MEKFYSDERNVQMLISLLKEHNIKKVIASPGHTNLGFVASLQNDPYFEMYSSVDERSAAYMACGLAAESKEPVVLSCTGATASRNYLPGLTEAYYRKLPILAVTSTQHSGRIGNYIPQVIDRTSMLNDIVNLSVQIPTITTNDDTISCNIKINKALLELRHRDGGPVHINLETNYSTNFNVKNLPKERVINRIEVGDNFPSLDGKKIILFIGNHLLMDNNLTALIDEFCEKYDTAVFCDKTSNYYGKYRIDPYIFCNQDQFVSSLRSCDILIHIGTVSGSSIVIKPSEVWRVNPDGEIRDTFGNLKYVYEMKESYFFKHYCDIKKTKKNITFFNQCLNQYNEIMNLVNDEKIPFSNVWVASKLVPLLKTDDYLHMGIFNSLRSCNYFSSNNKIWGFSNTGGFGIDGCLSSLLGASLANKNSIHYGIVGDLAFFYDMNALGNRHLSNNVRIIVVNNGCGTEFHNYNARGSVLENSVDEYVAAGGHYSAKSKDLIKNYVETLGIKYLRANNKDEFLSKLNCFMSEQEREKPIIFEVFTTPEDESNALKYMNNLQINTTGAAKNVAKKLLGEKGIKFAKNILKK